MRKPKIIDNLYKTYRCAMENAAHLEPWKGHFLVRRVETEILADKFNFNKDHIGLELGCGNAFQSALLASVSKKMYAADLFKENKGTHSLGLHKAQDLIDGLDIENISLVSCSAVSLPFVDSYFDFVFLSSVLEHIDDRKSALAEIKRVLKPGGYLILIVPTHMAGICAFPHVFLYFFARAMKLVFNCANRSGRDSGKKPDKPLAGRFKRNHPSFPLPEPHGAYANIFNELCRQFPCRWNGLVERSGFRIIKDFSICLLPWLLIEPFSTNAGANLYCFSRGLHSIDSGCLSFLGYLNCSIAVKKV